MTSAKLDANVRALRGTVMSLPVTNSSSESDYYVGLPSGFNALPTGILGEDVVETGYPHNSLWLDPNTQSPINGSTPPPPCNLQRRSCSLITSGTDVQVFAADTTIQAEDQVVIADAYGRVTSIRNVPTGTKANVVGRAKHSSGAVNQKIPINLG
jgi:hypothetical protein